MQISIIIPVLNEKGLNARLRDLKKKLPHGRGEIIVVDASANGATIAAITDPEINTLMARQGRGHQQNRGAAAATGHVLLFLHADTRLPCNFYPLICRTIAAGYGGGAFDLHIDSSHPLIKCISQVAAFRSRITGIPYGDQAIFITRALFHRIGGFPDIPLMEDIALMQKIKKSRVPFCILSAQAITSARTWHTRGILYTMIRNPVLAGLYYLGVPPRFLVKFYY